MDRKQRGEVIWIIQVKTLYPELFGSFRLLKMDFYLNYPDNYNYLIFFDFVYVYIFNFDSLYYNPSPG